MAVNRVLRFTGASGRLSVNCRVGSHRREGREPVLVQQSMDTLVGYLTHGRHSARVNAQIGLERQERHVAFTKEN